jgi:hypothetical protein
VLPADGWDVVLRRALEADHRLRRAAMGAVTELLVGHPQSRAFGSLARAAHEVADVAARRRLVPADAVSRVAGLTLEAANALALREWLVPAHGRALYAPFARTDAPLEPSYEPRSDAPVMDRRARWASHLDA